MKDVDRRELEAIAAGGDEAAIDRLRAEEKRTATVKVRPFLLALGRGTESHHLVFQRRRGLCGGEIDIATAKWVPWSDGETLLQGPLSCERCHRYMDRLTEQGFLGVCRRQVTVANGEGIERPHEDDLGLVVLAKESGLSEDEIARAKEGFEEMVQRGSIVPLLADQLAAAEPPVARAHSEPALELEPHAVLGPIVRCPECSSPLHAGGCLTCNPVSPDSVAVAHRELREARYDDVREGRRKHFSDNAGTNVADPNTLPSEPSREDRPEE